MADEMDGGRGRCVCLLDQGSSSTTNSPRPPSPPPPSPPSTPPPPPPLLLLPIAPTTPTTATTTKVQRTSSNRTALALPEIKRRLRTHLRESGVMDAVLAQLRASLLLPPAGCSGGGGGGKQQQQLVVEEEQWRRGQVEVLQARVKELEAAAQQQQEQQEGAVDTAALEERVKKECEARLRQEVEQGKQGGCLCVVGRRRALVTVRASS